jgi:hypothetical protein
MYCLRAARTREIAGTDCANAQQAPVRAALERETHPIRQQLAELAAARAAAPGLSFQCARCGDVLGGHYYRTRTDRHGHPAGSLLCRACGNLLAARSNAHGEGNNDE